MRRVTSCLGLLAVLAAAGLASPDDDFFCVTADSGADRLVLVDSANGTVTVLGGLRVHLANPSLTLLGDRLFLLDSIVDIRADFYELDPTSGLVLSWAPLTLGGNLVKVAEGFTTTSTGLLVGYRGSGTGPASNSLGDLGLDGVISNPTDFAPDNDFDGLAADSADRLFSTDQFWPETRSSVSAVDRANADVTWLAEHATKFSALEFTETDRMIALDRESLSLHELDLTFRRCPDGFLVARRVCSVVAKRSRSSRVRL